LRHHLDERTTIGTVHVKEMWVTDFASALGDSGGSMTNNGTLAGGILSATSTTSTYYTSMQNIGGHVAVRPCYTPACG